ncbi:hypothetical protein JCM25156A_03740 [Komagataeibacter kakiaceti JCM 25156]|uniref:hypothetical protein n=1 Tax=Komagataeibacter kakiaceti TaxID=943261 RepID=UPI0011DDCBB7|nr:hypothetical protein [Komagataeibacter kakiaceti]
MAGRKFERYGPYIVAIASGGIWFISGFSLPKDPSGLLGASATLAAVFAGFLGVSQGLILTIKDSEVYGALKKTDLLGLLFEYLKEGISGSVMFAIISVAGFFVAPQGQHMSAGIVRGFGCLWAASGAYSCMTYQRITGIMFKLLNKV